MEEIKIDVEFIDTSFVKFKFISDDPMQFFDIKMTIADMCSVYLPGYKFMPSYKAGIFDGKKKYFKITENDSIFVPYGLTKDIIEKLNKIFNEESGKKIIFNILEEPKLEFDITFDEFIKTVKFPFEPYSYQIDMVKDMITEQRLIALACTGAGKSLSLYLVLRYLLTNNKRTILLVPNISLLNQMYSDFDEYMTLEDQETRSWFLDSIKLIGGEHKDKTLAKINISTYASARAISKELNNMDGMIWDEAHLAKSPESELILLHSNEVPMKVGLTGTLPSIDVQRISLLATLGHSKRYITVRELIDSGRGVEVIVNAVFLRYKSDDVALMKKIRRNKYQEEIKFIEEHQERQVFLNKFINKVSDKFGNTIVLYNRTKHGQKIYTDIVKSRTGKNIDFEKDKKIFKDFEYQKELKVFFISGSVKGNVREKIRKILEEYDDAIIVANFKIMGAGINIKKLHAIILASSVKSDVTIAQTIGRGLRTHNTKTRFYLFDIVDDLSYTSRYGKKYPNYIIKHFNERLNIYMENEFTIKEIRFSL